MGKPMEATQLTIRLPKAEIAFLKNFAAQRKVTVSELIDQYVQQLRIVENYQAHPDTEKFAGVLPEHENAYKSYLDFLEEKHR